MTTILGLVVVFIMVFGGYMLAGGKFGIIIKALPFEMMMIGGAALGTFLMANSMHDVKHTLGGFGKTLCHQAHQGLILRSVYVSRYALGVTF
jgi:chemotaxis protein MotA